MIKTLDGYRAHRLEHLSVPGGRGLFKDDSYYILDGHAGLWRRLSIDRAEQIATSEPSAPVVTAWFRGDIIKLTPAPLVVAEELKEAGLRWCFRLKQHPAQPYLNEEHIDGEESAKEFESEPAPLPEDDPEMPGVAAEPGF